MTQNSPRPPRRRTLRRTRSSVALLALMVASAACGLQQTGIDGVVTAGEAGTAAGGQIVGEGGAAVLGTDPGAGGAGASGGADGGSTAGGSATSGGSGGSSSGGSGISGGGVSGAGGGTATGTGTSGAGGQVPPQTPGLKGEIVAAYVNVTGFDQLADSFVIDVASTGDARAMAKAMADHVNSQGGVAGRKLIPKVHDYNAQQASEVNDNNLCQTITTTDKAFMAVLSGQIHASARSCYKAKKTLALEGGAYGWSKDFYDAHDPYYWSASYSHYDPLLRALLKRIKESGWLKGQTKAGIILWDDEAYHSLADKVLAPGLKALGVEVVKASVSNSDIGSIESGLHAAAQTMVANQVTHLTFVGSAPLQPFFVQQNTHYEQFKYALTTYDVPRYMDSEFKRNMAGAIGVGIAPVDDVFDAQYPFPQPGMEATCVEIYKRAGIEIPGRYVDGEFNSKQAISYCETTLMLKQVADKVGANLTREAWAAEAKKLGSSFQAGMTFRTSYRPGKTAGADLYRDITFDATCTCMRYTSGTKALS